LDPAMTGLSRGFPPLAELNNHALDDARVQVVNQDAMIWLETPHGLYDVALLDFPDPNNFSLGKLYTRRFFRLLRTHVDHAGAVAMQCTSPMYSRKAYWCIVNTMRAAGWHVRPYHVEVPSFGPWGFALAKKEPFRIPARCRPDLRFLDTNVLPALFEFSKDIGPVETDVNRLDNQVLVRYYDEDWTRNS